MEENSSVFSYLGEDMMQQQLAEISNSLQQCFDPGSQQFQNLAKYTKKLARKREKWPEKIFATWRKEGSCLFT
jgi:hypothetical protein